VQFLYNNPKAGIHKDIAFEDIRQQFKVFEKILCFNDWLTAKKHNNNNIDPADNGNDSLSLTKIRNLMEGIKHYFP
jgi:hypothetical protein